MLNNQVKSWKRRESLIPPSVESIPQTLGGQRRQLPVPIYRGLLVRCQECGKSSEPGRCLQTHKEEDPLTEET